MGSKGVEEGGRKGDGRAKGGRGEGGTVRQSVAEALGLKILPPAIR